MNGKRTLWLLLAMFTTVAMIALAGDERRPTSTRTDKDIPRKDVQAAGQVEVGREQLTPQLEPGIAQIEADYGVRMEALKTELAAAITEQEREVIQQRAQQLKVEWTLALIDRQIDLARQQGDSKTESELLASKQAMLNPPVIQRQQVPRDPNAGIQIEGGAK